MCWLRRNHKEEMLDVSGVCTNQDELSLGRKKEKRTVVSPGVSLKFLCVPSIVV